MGAINEFGDALFNLALKGRETVEMTGIGSLASHKGYALFGATSHRLLVIECPADAWLNAPQPAAANSRAFEYGELEEVVVTPMTGPGKRLLVRGSGETTEAILRQDDKSVGHLWNYAGFDHHREFYDVFPEWLAHHFTARSLTDTSAIAELREQRDRRARVARETARALRPKWWCLR